MTDLMQREMLEIFYMVAGGMSVMMVYTAGQKIAQRVKAYKRLYPLVYLFSWFCAAYLFCQFLYQGTYGKISWYTLPAFGIGCILWKKCFCGILNLYEHARKYNGDENI